MGKKYINKFSKIQWFSILRLIIGFVFLLSTFNKLYDPVHFKMVIAGYKILPNSIIPIIAIILPWIEFFCGIMIMLNIYTKSNSLILFSVLIVFILAISINLFRGVIHDCGCFDFFNITENIGILIILRDVLFLVFIFLIYCYSDNKPIMLDNIK